MNPVMEMESLTISWYLERYNPRPMEFDSLVAWRSAVKQAQLEPALRLTKLSHGLSSQPGHYLPVFTAKVGIDDIPHIAGSTCQICGKPNHKYSITTAGIGLHKKCLGNMISEHLADSLLIFAAEKEERRKITQIFALI